MEKQKEKVEKLKEEINDYQEEFANLDWISKKNALQIIKKIFN
jgi:hypothetical protein